MEANAKIEGAAALLLGVSVDYGAREVVSDVDLEFPRNEVTCLVGPGASGKSTLLTVLEALVDAEAVTEGDGQPSWRGLGMARVASCARMRQHGLRSDRSIAALLDEVGESAASLDLPLDDLPESPALEAIGDLPIAEAPDSLRRALSFALVARSGRELLLFDEPLFALPPALAAWVRGQLLALKRAGQTMVVVTHNLALARLLADRVALLVDGELVEAGRAEPFFNHARHPRTRQYLCWGG